MAFAGRVAVSLGPAVYYPQSVTSIAVAAKRNPEVEFPGHPCDQQEDLEATVSYELRSCLPDEPTPYWSSVSAHPVSE